MNTLYADLKPQDVSSPVPPPAHTQTPATRGWDTQTGSDDPQQPERRHTPISAVTADKAAAARSTGRLTYSAGWSSKKAITFDAAI